MIVLVLFSNLNRQDSRARARGFNGAVLAEKIKSWLRDTARVSFLIIVLMLPVFAAYFHLSALSGALANAVAVPLSFWIMITSLAALFTSFIFQPAALWMAAVSSHLFSVLYYVLEKIAGISFLSWHLPTPSWPASAVYYGVLAVFYWHPALRRWKYAGICAVVCLFLTLHSFLVPQGAAFFDTGHSDSIFLRLSGRRHLLITAGRKLSESRLGWAIEPALLSAGTKRLFVLFGDSRKNLSREPMERLVRNFSLKDFDPALFPDLLLFRLKSGKLAACLAKSSKSETLILFAADWNLIHDLRRLGIRRLDTLYVAGGFKEDFQSWMSLFLKEVHVKQIIFNDRKLPPRFLSQVSGLGRSVLHFLSEGGAVSV